jgi:broad specificity phosphatase PhoE
MGEIILLRHGETEWSRSGRHTGRTDVPLTPTGERQAEAAGKLLATTRIAAVWLSPANRALHTARLAGLNADGTDPDLWEWDYGAYEGITTADIQATRPGWSLWHDGVPAGDPARLPGENAAQVGARCDRMIERLLPLVTADSPDALDGDIVLVAHGHVSRVLAARWIGLPPAAGALFRFDTAAVSRLGFEHGTRVLTLWNQSP